jgi:hypothetical protein
MDRASSDVLRCDLSAHLHKSVTRFDPGRCFSGAVDERPGKRGSRGSERLGGVIGAEVNA